MLHGERSALGPESLKEEGGHDERYEKRGSRQCFIA